MAATVVGACSCRTVAVYARPTGKSDYRASSAPLVVVVGDAVSGDYPRSHGRHGVGYIVDGGFLMSRRIRRLTRTHTHQSSCYAALAKSQGNVRERRGQWRTQAVFQEKKMMGVPRRPCQIAGLRTPLT